MPFVFPKGRQEDPLVKFSALPPVKWVEDEANIRRFSPKYQETGNQIEWPLVPEVVAAIRIFGLYYDYEKIATEIALTRVTISRIVRGRNYNHWTWLTCKLDRYLGSIPRPKGTIHLATINYHILPHLLNSGIIQDREINVDNLRRALLQPDLPPPPLEGFNNIDMALSP